MYLKIFVGGSICTNLGAALKATLGWDLLLFRICFQFLSLAGPSAECPVGISLTGNLIYLIWLVLLVKISGNCWHSFKPKFLIFPHPPHPGFFGLVGALPSCKSDKKWLFYSQFCPWTDHCTWGRSGKDLAGRWTIHSAEKKILQSSDAPMKMCHCCNPPKRVYINVCISNLPGTADHSFAWCYKEVPCPESLFQMGASVFCMKLVKSAISPCPWIYL